jgi:hypothetical protein
MTIEVDPALLKALYSKLLSPVKLVDGTPVYPLSVNLARELRDLIAPLLK